MRIIFVTNMYPNKENPGWGTFVKQQADQIRRLGHQVDVLQIFGYKSKLKYLQGAVDIFLKTNKVSYQIVHAHYGLSGLIGLFRWRAPLVVTLHGSDALVGKIEPFISKFVCHMADEVIVVSKKINSIIPGNIIPCGVDMDEFKPVNMVEARKKLNLSKNKRLILFPFDHKRSIKRYDIATSCIERLKTMGHDCELLKVHGVENKIMVWYYNAADVMILCSDSEGSPTSIKEALSCNTPVVSVDVGDVREIMDGISGTKICPQNIDLITESLDQVLSKKDKSKFDGRTAMKRYDQRKTAKSIVKVYEKALKKRSHFF